jgi:hypothetical protein
VIFCFWATLRFFFFLVQLHHARGVLHEDGPPQQGDDTWWIGSEGVALGCDSVGFQPMAARAPFL